MSAERAPGATGAGAVEAPHFEDPRGEPQREKPSRIQRTIAARMLEVKNTVPEFTVSDEIDMEPVTKIRAAWDRDDPDRPSVNDFIVKAAALTLKEHPTLNGSWTDEGIERYSRVNVGIAVAAPGLLLVPTIFDADRLDLTALARESRRLAAAVRERSIQPAELSGATFTVSNLGMFGIADFEAIIAAPQAAILAVAAARETPVVKSGTLVPGIRMSARLASDHRLVYGADAAAFMRDLRTRLESPADWA
ncbi:MAG: catalytic domain of component of various dehydrogenase complexe [Solirubrobacterales bacterium]|nr:catalytic domain of component of various dehydrogenase complexe [Solirubrobacterales bacterium]